jgi:hypothetical protein
MQLMKPVQDLRRTRKHSDFADPLAAAKRKCRQLGDTFRIRFLK